MQAGTSFSAWPVLCQLLYTICHCLRWIEMTEGSGAQKDAAQIRLISTAMCRRVVEAGSASQPSACLKLGAC